MVHASSLPLPGAGHGCRGALGVLLRRRSYLFSATLAQRAEAAGRRRARPHGRRAEVLDLELRRVDAANCDACTARTRGHGAPEGTFDAGLHKRQSPLVRRGADRHVAASGSAAFAQGHDARIAHKGGHRARTGGHGAPTGTLNAGLHMRRSPLVHWAADRHVATGGSTALVPGRDACTARAAGHGAPAGTPDAGLHKRRRLLVQRGADRHVAAGGSAALAQGPKVCLRGHRSLPAVDAGSRRIGGRDGGQRLLHRDAGVGVLHRRSGPGRQPHLHLLVGYGWQLWSVRPLLLALGLRSSAFLVSSVPRKDRLIARRHGGKGRRRGGHVIIRRPHPKVPDTGLCATYGLLRRGGTCRSNWRILRRNDRCRSTDVPHVGFQAAGGSATTAHGSWLFGGSLATGGNARARGGCDRGCFVAGSPKAHWHRFGGAAR
mmetsp:Transcript_69665/g.192643  ORF Transcript_69665/g.192643 Transcript_69665/m.192643 type:complete len:433 (-) Transcript_69665:675-1973(-)